MPIYIDYTPEQKALREELRGYFAELMSPELEEEIHHGEGGGPLYRQALRKMGEDGWLGIGWPAEYGGQGRSAMDQYVFADEVQRAGFPLPFLTLGTVGPTIMRFGTEEQKREFLPQILRGECQFAIGYSEPEAGTDLASLKTRAVREGDDYVINGQKVFTSLAHFADYIWLAARTDPNAPKHRGISVFIVSTKSPGYKCVPIHTMTGIGTNATFYENVRVPARLRVGPENHGWTLITNQLNHERISLMPVGSVERLVDAVRVWAQETKLADGKRVIDRPWVREHLAWCSAQLEALKLMQWKQAWAIGRGALNPGEASAVKVFGSEFYVECYRRLMDVIGPGALVCDGSPGAVLGARLERLYRTTLILTFGGGTNEVQRDIVAMASLGLPHYKR